MTAWREATSESRQIRCSGLASANEPAPCAETSVRIASRAFSIAAPVSIRTRARAA